MSTNDRVVGITFSRQGLTETERERERESARINRQRSSEEDRERERVRARERWETVQSNAVKHNEQLGKVGEIKARNDTRCTLACQV